MRRSRIDRVARWAVFLFAVFVAWDYLQYHARLRQALSVVADCGGRTGSLLDWPLGRELDISFTQPPTEQILERLRVLNGLAGRHWVGIRFECKLSDAEFQHVKSVLVKCHVRHVDPEDGSQSTAPETGR